MVGLDIAIAQIVNIRVPQSRKTAEQHHVAHLETFENFLHQRVEAEQGGVNVGCALAEFIGASLSAGLRPQATEFKFCRFFCGRIRLGQIVNIYS